MKKIITSIINFLKIIFEALTSPFRKNKKEEKVNTATIKSNKLEQIKLDQIPLTGAVTSMPDDDNKKTNPHIIESDEGETESTRIYSLPRELSKILKVNEKYTYLAFSDEEINILIDDVLEDKYKEEGFKVYKANNIIKKKIEKLKEEIIPIIKDKIYYSNIVDSKKLKEEIKIIVNEQLEKTPIFEEKITITPKTKKGEKKDPYVIALPKPKEIKLEDKPIEIKKDDIVLTTEKKEEIKENINSAPMRMVPTEEEIKEPTVITELPKIAAAVAITTAKEIVDIVSTKPEEENPSLKKENKKEDLPEEKKEETTEEEVKEEAKEEIELPKISEKPTKEETKKIDEEIDAIAKEAETITEEIKTIEEEVEEIISASEEIKEEKEERFETIKKEEDEEKEDIKKNLNIDMNIDKVENKTYDVIEEAKEETTKHDFFEKDYDKEEKRINDMLDKISDTKIKYGDKLTDKQKERLEKQEEQLRSAKEQLKTSKEKDIAFETKELNATIKSVELEGLQQEIKNMHLDYDIETNNNLLKKMDKLEGMTKEQVADIDKKIMMKRFNKASFLLEMTSLLAFPFVRNKYFRYFTIGLVIDNHLGFAHAFLNRKANRYQPVDLEEIKKGQDALNGALDLAYKDLIELDYIEEQAISRYPELATDPAYQASINRVRNNLTSQYNKLMKKQNTMEKYMNKGKRQKKILERREAA